MKQRKRIPRRRSKAPETLYTTPQVIEIFKNRMTLRQLMSYVRSKFLEPTEVRGRKQGKVQLWSLRDLVLINLIGQMYKAGLAGRALKEYLDLVRTDRKFPFDLKKSITELQLYTLALKEPNPIAKVVIDLVHLVADTQERLQRWQMRHPSSSETRNPSRPTLSGK